MLFRQDATYRRNQQESNDEQELEQQHQSVEQPVTSGTEKN